MKYKAQWKHRWKSVAAALLLAVSITGCSGVPSTSNVKETPGYTLPQSMIIVATERNRYQQIYTSDLWNVTLNNGMTFQIYLLDQVQTFLQNMKTMSLLAKDQDITLTGSEKDRLRRLSETYYEGLSQDDIAYMGIDLDDVITMYQEYYLANKVVGELTKELNLEVSDSEAKVITIQQLAVSDRDTANQLYEQAAAEGSDFAAIAQEHSEVTPIERQLGRGVEDTTFENAAFNLAAGQISPVIESEGKFYIIKCISDYDEKATAERKTQIYTERKNQVFKQIYNQFQTDNEINFSDDMWETITFSPNDKTTTTNFFGLYQKEFH